MTTADVTSNSSSQVGIGDNTSCDVPRPVDLRPGDAVAWGLNNAGQVGDGTTTNRTTATNVLLPDGGRLASVDAGDMHSVGVDAKGNVWSWGMNTYGQLGDGTTTGRHQPVRVLLPDGVYVWKIVVGYAHNFAVTNTMDVYAWGYNEFGQLGDGTTTNRLTPVLVNLPDVNIGSIVAGGFHNLAFNTVPMNDSGGASLMVWGRNTFGQLGDGTTTDRHVPTLVTVPEIFDGEINLAAGNCHSLFGAIASYGMGIQAEAIWAWGLNNYGQVGDGTTTDRYIPTPVAYSEHSDQDPRSLHAKAGYNHSFMIDYQGNVTAWGLNNSGQLGDGTTTTRLSPVSVSMPGNDPVYDAAGGGYHSVFTAASGTRYACGSNQAGQLGNGTTTDSRTPIPVPPPTGTTFSDIVPGISHNVVMLT